LLDKERRNLCDWHPRVPHQIFISHCDKDKAAADQLLNALEGLGAKCWMAPRDVPPGGSYADAILTAIEESRCFVLIYTNSCNDSPHVLREVERALKFNLNIVPIRLDDSPPSRGLDYLLATVHWLSAVAGDRRAIESAAKQIESCIASPQKLSPQDDSSADRTSHHVTSRARPFSERVVLWAVILLLAAGLVVTLFLFWPREKRNASAAPSTSTPIATPFQTPSPTPVEVALDSQIASAPPSVHTPTDFTTRRREAVESQLWLIPDSSVRRLTARELAGYSKEMLWRARNEIYARRGFIFHTDRGRRFAQSLGPQYSGVDGNETRVYNRMNDIEQANVGLFLELENAAP
jgi:hypothetical protein